MDAPSFLIIRGILGLVIGIVAFAWPAITIAALVAMFGVFALIDGVINLFLGLTHNAAHERSWATAVQGLVGIAAGVLAFLWPGLTAFALVIFIGSWAIVTGVFEIIAAIRLREIITGEWLLVLSGVMSVVFGVLVCLFPGPGAVGIAWILGTYAAASGLVLIALGVRLRSRVAMA